MATLCRGFRGKVLAKYSLKAPVVVLGRDATCDITLDGGLVSRRHCQFVRSGDAYLVEDLGSSNGTYVNSVPVQGKQLLRDGDKIAVIGHVLTYRTQDELPEAMPTAEEGEAAAEYSPTMRVNPHELQRRLRKLFEEPGTPAEGDEGPGKDGSCPDDRT